jgi:hypothetical protein
VSLGDEFAAEAATRQHNGKKTRIAEIMEQLSDEDRAQFQEALDNKNITPSVIETVMTKRGFKLTANMIYNYRQGKYVTI